VGKEAAVTQSVEAAVGEAAAVAVIAMAAVERMYLGSLGLFPLELPE
jgi:hypothetical protein